VVRLKVACYLPVLFMQRDQIFPRRDVITGLSTPRFKASDKNTSGSVMNAVNSALAGGH